ncbi:NifU family protein [Saprospira grandis]|uniref:Nitrogen-fixing NifU domain protein n=1 Tax=Saprospira grandis (strain Lewin) TaxID=984262 RepID=H6KZ54_SAPGL|nr:NifU family protein [Saprospira grandis]AFC23338.1 nitrogen-fixing NifU domain protein [Saprospira grandis str. Lewin]WBM75053.1 NifU family protein [Saprospira grandis]
MSNKKELLARVDEALNSIRPHLKADGGDIEVVDLTEDMCLKVKWLGNCQSCSMSGMTMKAGIESTVKSVIPEILTVEAINGQ